MRVEDATVSPISFAIRRCDIQVLALVLGSWFLSSGSGSDFCYIECWDRLVCSTVEYELANTVLSVQPTLRSASRFPLLSSPK